MKKTFILFFIKILLLQNLFAQLGYSEEGLASYYGKEFHGRRTACGEKCNLQDFTAAHKSLPFQTIVKVTNLKNNKSVLVRINDRGPFSKKRIIDLSRAAAAKIDMISAGIAKVRIEVVGLNGEFPNEDSLINNNAEESLKLVDEKNEETNVIPDENSLSFETTLNVNNLEVGKTYNNKGIACEPSGFGIQVFSLSDKNKLQDKIKELENKGLQDYFIKVLKINKKTIYRVLLGEFSNKKEAENKNRIIKSKGYSSFVKQH